MLLSRANGLSTFINYINLVLHTRLLWTCGGTVRNTGAVMVAAGSIDLSVAILALIWFFMPLRVSE